MFYHRLHKVLQKLAAGQRIEPGNRLDEKEHVRFSWPISRLIARRHSSRAVSEHKSRLRRITTTDDPSRHCQCQR
jgi:hypothetical protein